MGAQKSHGHPALPVGFPAPPSVAFDEGPRLHCWDGIGPREQLRRLRWVVFVKVEAIQGMPQQVEMMKILSLKSIF